jgi:hypothetical protein
VSQTVSKKFWMINCKVFKNCRQEASSQPRYHSPLSNFPYMTHTRHKEAVKTQGWYARCFTDRLVSPQGDSTANTEQASAVVKEARLTRDVLRYSLGWREPTIWGANWASRRSRWKFIISVSMSFMACLSECKTSRIAKEAFTICDNGKR